MKERTDEQKKPGIEVVAPPWKMIILLSHDTYDNKCIDLVKNILFSRYNANYNMVGVS